MKTKLNIIIIFFLIILNIISGSNVFFSKLDIQRRKAEEADTLGRFGQLEYALNQYYENNGKYPPIRYQEKPGEPFHSWRVLLLPYLDDKARDGFKKYNFKKEWNDIENIYAIGEITPRSYTSVDNQKLYTNFLAIGPNDQWEESRPLKSWVVKNGADSFVLFEKPNSEVKWAEPIY